MIFLSDLAPGNNCDDNNGGFPATRLLSRIVTRSGSPQSIVFHARSSQTFTSSTIVSTDFSMSWRLTHSSGEW